MTKFMKLAVCGCLSYSSGFLPESISSALEKAFANRRNNALLTPQNQNSFVSL